MGAVDRRLLEEGRLHRLETAEDVVLEKKEPGPAARSATVSDLVDRIEAVAKRGRDE